MKVIELGRTQAAVRILHMKRSVLYFVENFLEQEIILLPYQRNLIMKLEEGIKIERLAREICREKCKDFGNKAAVDYLVDDQWQEWIPEAIELLKERRNKQ